MADIVVIDDETDVRESIELILIEAGHTVRTASDGPSGVLACRKRAPDLVITDLIMPNAHGFDVIAELCREIPRIRIVAISGGGNFWPLEYQPEALTTRAYLAAALKFGAVSTLTKPFDREELLRSVASALTLPAG